MHLTGKIPASFLGQPHIYVASTPQYLELIAVLDYSYIVATPVLKPALKVKLPGNNIHVRGIIVTHAISVDAQTNRCGSI